MEKMLIPATSTLFISSTVFASTISSTLKTEMFDTQAQTYEAGF